MLMLMPRPASAPNILRADAGVRPHADAEDEQDRDVGVAGDPRLRVDLADDVLRADQRPPSGRSWAR